MELEANWEAAHCRVQGLGFVKGAGWPVAHLEVVKSLELMGV